MSRTLSLKELYIELEKDPDLRRLGKYKVTANEDAAIIPIDIDLDGKDVYLGEGNFSDGLTALGKTKARVLDLGSSTFTDLYLDYLEVETLRCANSRAGRLFFDYAKAVNFNFDNFICPEVYFDLAEVGNVYIENLSCGIVYPAKLQAKNVDFGGRDPESFRYAFDKGGVGSFGGVGSEQSLELTQPKKEDGISLTPDEFIAKLQENPDLRRLGAYKITPTGGGEQLVLYLNFPESQINLGAGDFTLVTASFKDSRAQSVSFGTSMFSDIALSGLETEKLDFAKSQIGLVNFGISKIKQCFLADSKIFETHFEEGDVGSFFGERGCVDKFYLDSSSIEQLNINNMQTEELHLGGSKIKEMYLSNGRGIKKILGEESELELLNLHEATLDVVAFGNSRIKKALINKCSIKQIYCENLVSDFLYVGNDGKQNKVGLLEVGENTGIERFGLKEILPSRPDDRTVFDTISFGEIKKRR